MTEEAKKIKEKLDVVVLNRDDFNKLNDDRIAYIYDSLCLQYLVAREKAALWDAYQDMKAGKINRDRVSVLNKLRTIKKPVVSVPIINFFCL